MPPGTAGFSYMSTASPSRNLRRSVLLLAVFLLVLVALVVQRTWLSPEAHEAQLARMSLTALEKRASTGSSDPELYFYLARRRVEVGDAQGGVQALERSLQLNPRFGKARVTLATLLLGQDRDEEAMLHLRQSIQDDPADADAYLGLALLYQRHQTWPLQSEAATAATRARPDGAQGWLLLGEAAEHLQDQGKAESCYEKAITLDPKNAQARARASVVEIDLGRLDRAEQHARDAIKAAPKDPAGYLALGQVLLRGDRRQLDEAESMFERAAGLGETTGAASAGTGHVLQLQGRHAEAEQQFRLALRANPANNDARYALVRALRAQGKEGEAAQVDRDFRKWVTFGQKRLALNNRIASPSGRPADWFTLARLYADMGLWSEARITTLSGLRRSPADPAGIKLLAEIDRNAR